MVLRARGRDDRLGRRYAHVPEGRFVRVRPQGVPHTFYVEAGEARALVGFRRCSSRIPAGGRRAGSRARIPPPLEGHPDMERLAPIAERNGSRSSAHRTPARPLTSQARPTGARWLHGRARTTTSQSERNHDRRHDHPYRQRPLPRSRVTVRVVDAERNRIRRPRADDDPPLPLRRLRNKAVLRRHPREHELRSSQPSRAPRRSPTVSLRVVGAGLGQNRHPLTQTRHRDAAGRSLLSHDRDP